MRLETGMFRLGYVPALDGLRAVAVLLVIGRHSDLLLPGTTPLLVGGWLGVDVFFVLSGFLITSLLLEEGRDTGVINLRHFHIRRALRLLPCLYLVTAATVIYSLLFQTGIQVAGTLIGAVSALSYITNWVIGIGNLATGALGHTWSLAIEEQFYLLWAPTLILLLRHRPSSLIWVTLALLIGSALLRIGLLLIDVPTGRLFVGLDTRADALMTGALAAGLLHQYKMGLSSRLGAILPVAAACAVAALGFLALVAEPYGSRYLYLGGFTLIAVCSATLILYLVLHLSPLTSSLATQPANYLGRISYGIYLWHFPIFIAVGAASIPPFAAVASGFCLTLAAASLRYHCLECPILRRKPRRVTAITLLVAAPSQQ